MDASAVPAPGSQGHTIVEKKLKVYLRWKGRLGVSTCVGGLSDGIGVGCQNQKKTGMGNGSVDGDGVNEALMGKDQVMWERVTSWGEVRGGAPPWGGGRNGGGSGSGSGSGRKEQKDTIGGENEMRDEAEHVANL